MKRVSPLVLAILTLCVPIRTATPQARPGTNGEVGTLCNTPLDLGSSTLSGAHADFDRAAQLAGVAPASSWLVRRTSREWRTPVCADPLTIGWARSPTSTRLPAGLALEVLPLSWTTHYNSAYPRDQNNGVLWAGRGLSTELRGGLALRWGPLSAALAPVLYHQRNRAFELAIGPARASHSPLIYQGRPTMIDWPQRFGDRPFGGIDLGDSHLRLDIYRLALGISHENLWWGPARRNPLLMSNTAGGFPHLFAGTSSPLNLWLGHLEGEVIWGRLRESDYFDFDPTNDRTLLASVVIGFEPRGLPGLYLGAARSFMRELPREGLPLSTMIISPYREVRENPLGRDHEAGDNQLFSIFARWAPPRSGFEAYFEFGRDDHWADLDDLLAEPDVSSAFTLGFQHVVPDGERWLRLSGEVTRISDSYPTVRRPIFIFYSHGQVRQGYTHRGQLLGAAIGPNSNALHLGVDLFTPNGRRGVFVERARYNVDANAERWVREYGIEGADIEWSIGIDQHLLLRRLDLGWALIHSYRRNRHYFGLYSDAPEFRTERNWSLRFDLGWRPRARPTRAALQQGDG